MQLLEGRLVQMQQAAVGHRPELQRVAPPGEAGQAGDVTLVKAL